MVECIDEGTDLADDPVERHGEVKAFIKHAALKVLHECGSVAEVEGAFGAR